MQARWAWAVAVAILGLPAWADDAAPPKSASDALKAAKLPAMVDPAPKPHPISPLPADEVKRSIRRGVDFLLKRQNKNGSWGSAVASRPVELYAPVPGAHLAFRAAVTAMCVSALIETSGTDPVVAAALDRAEAWLFANLPNVRRPSVDTVYNSWTHAYAIQALARMLDRKPEDTERAKKIRELIRQQIGMLERYEFVDGGWAYYEFKARTQKPSDSSIAFVTAAVLVAFHDAQRVGVEPPQRLVDRAMASIRRQRRPDFSILYGEYFKYRPMRPINRPAGSLGRTQACNVAMRMWGDPLITDDVLENWLNRLFARNLWLDIGRKRPIPHETWFQVAGYFFYFGHYYAALCIEQLPESQRQTFQEHLAAVLVPLQEKDGSWWDFPLYDYHQQYGTAFALMSLQRTLPKDGAGAPPKTTKE